MLEKIAATASRELFLLTVIVVALGTALITEAAGLSLALGAFLAGIVVSETDFRHQIVAEIVPLREAFATLFFVSVGMLLDVDALRDDPLLVVAMIAFIALVKFGVFAGIVRGFGVPAGTAILVGLLLAQTGEFSLVLAGEGLDRGLLTDAHYAVILAGTLGTILLTPFTVSAGPRLAGLAERAGLARGPATRIDEEDTPLQRHTIVCGYGRLGAELVRALARRGVPCAVVDDDPTAVRRARAAGASAIYGDAGNPDVLRKMGIERARTLAVAISDPLAAEAVVAFGSSLEPTAAHRRALDELGTTPPPARSRRGRSGPAGVRGRPGGGALRPALPRRRRTGRRRRYPGSPAVVLRTARGVMAVGCQLSSYQQSPCGRVNSGATLSKCANYQPLKAESRKLIAANPPSTTSAGSCSGFARRWR